MKIITHCMFMGLGLLLFACNNSSDLNKTEEEINTEILLQTSFNGKQFSIPSPVLTTLLLKEVEAPYAPDLLIMAPDVEKQTDEISQALYLGVLAADLGYTSFYNDNTRIVKYLLAVEKLAAKLGLDREFNKEFIKRYEANISKSDSLVQLSTEAFKQTDYYLKNSDRYESSLMILVGGWIETIHFASNLALTSDKAELIQRIGEQKQTLQTIMSILSDIDMEKKNPALVTAFNNLDATYQNVAMHYTYSEPSIDIENQITTLNHTISFDVTEKNLNDIKTKITVIRNLIIN